MLFSTPSRCQLKQPWWLTIRGANTCKVLLLSGTVLRAVSARVHFILKTTLLLSTLYKYRNWGTEKLSNLPRITEHVGVVPASGSPLCIFQRHIFGKYISAGLQLTNIKQNFLFSIICTILAKNSDIKPLLSLGSEFGSNYSWLCWPGWVAECQILHL